MRKTAVFILIAVLIPALSAVAGGSQEKAVADKVENIEFLAWWAKKYAPDDANIKYLGDKFKAHFTITTIPHNVYFDQLNVKVAANDLPVMYKHQLPNGYAFKLYQELINANRLQNLNPLIEKYNLVNLKDYLSKPSFDHLVGRNGEKYAMPVYMAASTTMIYVRQDWVDKLGLTIPKTWDDFRGFAKALKDANLSGKVTAGAGGYITGLIYDSYVGFSGDFGLYNGKWIHRAFHPGYKEAVRYIRDFYKSGVLHPNSLLTNEGPNERMKLFIDENEGMMVHNGLSSHFAQVVDSLTKNNPNAKVGYVPIPANREGKIIASQPVAYYGVDTINADYSESAKVKALQILDYLHSDSGRQLMFDGVEGVHYTVQNGKKVYDPQLRSRDFIGATSPLTEISDLSFPFEREVAQLKGNYAYNEDHAYFSQVVGLVTDPYLDSLVKINEVVDTYLPKFYSGELDVDRDWDRFLGEIRQNGYDTAIHEIEKFKSM